MGQGTSQKSDTLFFSSKAQKAGQNGDGAITGRFGCIQILEDDTTFSDLVCPDHNDVTIREGLTYNKGEVLYGRCTSFTVSAGTAEGHEF